MDPNALAGMGFVLFILTLVTIIAVVVIWQVLKTAREKTRYAVELAINDAYRRLAEQAVAVEEKWQRYSGFARGWPQWKTCCARLNNEVGNSCRSRQSQAIEKGNATVRAPCRC